MPELARQSARSSRCREAATSQVRPVGDGTSVLHHVLEKVDRFALKRRVDLLAPPQRRGDPSHTTAQATPGSHGASVET